MCMRVLFFVSYVAELDPEDEKLLEEDVTTGQDKKEVRPIIFMFTIFLKQVFTCTNVLYLH